MGSNETSLQSCGWIEYRARLSLIIAACLMLFMQLSAFAHTNPDAPAHDAKECHFCLIGDRERSDDPERFGDNHDDGPIDGADYLSILINHPFILLPSELKQWRDVSYQLQFSSILVSAQSSRAPPHSC